MLNTNTRSASLFFLLKKNHRLRNWPTPTNESTFIVDHSIPGWPSFGSGLRCYSLSIWNFLLFHLVFCSGQGNVQLIFFSSPEYSSLTVAPAKFEHLMFNFRQYSNSLFSFKTVSTMGEAEVQINWISHFFKNQSGSSHPLPSSRFSKPAYFFNFLMKCKNFSISACASLHPPSPTYHP